MEYVGQIDGATLAVAVQGSTLYIGTGYKLLVTEISDPCAPQVVGKTQPLPGIIADVTIAGDTAYIADDSAGMRIVSIADPAQPVEVGFYSVPMVAQENSPSPIVYDDVAGVAVANGYAYVAEYDHGLRVVDISDPTHPQEVGFYDTPGEAHGVALAGEYAHVADFEQGVRVVNIADPTRPVEVSAYDTPGAAQYVAIAGDYAFVADGAAGLQVVNISDPTRPALAGSFATQGYTQSVAILGTLAYVADGSAGVWVLDIGDPVHPVMAGFFDTPGYAWHVAVAGEYVYVADANQGVIILRYTGK